MGTISRFATMKDRILQLMKEQHLTQQSFANFIGISPASLSNIFKGRTKPTLSIAEAILRKLPNVSTDWLLFGKGEMYNSSLPSVEAGTGSDGNAEPTNGANTSENRAPSFFDKPAEPSAPVKESAVTQTIVKYVDKPKRKVSRITVFYDDQSFETFVPEKK